MMALKTYLKSLPASLYFLALLSGCGHHSPAAAPPPPTVGTLTIEPKEIQLTTQLPGRTTAFLTSSVQPQVSGIIKRRNFEEGSEVKEGQSLYEIDPLTYQATYDSDMATLAHARAALLTAKAKINRYRPLAKAHAVSMQDYVKFHTSHESISHFRAGKLRFIACMFEGRTFCQGVLTKRCDRPRHPKAHPPSTTP